MKILDTESGCRKSINRSTRSTVCAATRTTIRTLISTTPAQSCLALPTGTIERSLKSHE